MHTLADKLDKTMKSVSNGLTIGFYKEMYVKKAFTSSQFTQSLDINSITRNHLSSRASRITGIM